MTVKELILMLLDQPLDKQVLFWADYEDFSSTKVKKIGVSSLSYYQERFPDHVQIELE